MYLPKAPVKKEQHLYLDPERLKLYSVSLLSVASLLTGMVLFVLNNNFIPYLAFTALTLVYLSISYAVGFFGRDFDVSKHIELWQKYLDRSAKQDLDILLPICGEPRQVIENTWRHVRLLKMNHEGNLRVYVLDDGKSDEMEALANQFGFYYIRRETNELKKAGNLRNAFKLISGEFFVIFNADFCPQINFLIETLPYFYENENVSIVQTPQFFEVTDDMTPVQKGAGCIQELFYRLIQVGRDSFGGAICVGTNAIYRRKHLEPFGGTAAIGYSEDVRTGFQLLRSGHEIKYIPVNLAKGVCPETWKQFFVQNYRWSMGSISLFLTKEFWASRISKWQGACYLTGMLYYISTGIGSVFAFVPSIFLLIYNPGAIHWFNLIWSIPSLLLTNVYMRYWQRVKFTFHAIECRQVSYYSHLFAIIDTLTGLKEAWVPTGAKIKSSNFTKFKYGLVIHTATLTVLVSGLCGFRYSQGYPILNFLPLMALLFYHLTTITRPMYQSFLDD